MPADRMKRPPADPARDTLLEALRAIDSAALEGVALETGIGLSTLWRYRTGRHAIAAARRRILERALGLR